MVQYSNLKYAIKDSIGYVIINREPQLNALNQETLDELQDIFKHFNSDDHVRGIILTGAGHKAFAAGADIKEFMDLSVIQARWLSERGHIIFTDLIEASPKPVIAAINGYALGGGLEMALACHIRIASENARMGLPEVSLGLIPGYGGTQRLPKLIGKGQAMQMILTGDMIDAQQAYELGLVNEVIAQDKLIARAEEILQKIFTRSRVAITNAIAAINAAEDRQQNGNKVEMDAFGHLFGTEDFKEGVSAFLGKRPPNFE
ncbi:MULTISPECIES: enoyl-CoA hydratase/isomerase family protein [Sphingobacterium]|jgi:enoyl-CoA hydratase|uniref:enoyl-CoA hydratase/isomerase family protein n=1 Tax=Sphingobacterium TaxID=28453 RepID=UPI000B48F192|nr:enoyl-CoA hydratase-related protein [Sphingobacterium sp. G1-14]